MATFGELVIDRIGAFTNDDLLDHTLSEGARIVVDILKPERLAIYAMDKTDADGSAGVVITGGRPTSAHKSGYGARLVPVEMKAVIADGDSIHYAVATDPAWYMEKTKGYVLPGGGIIKWVAYPSVDASADETISDFPSEAYAVVVLYSAMQCQMSIISTLIVTTLGGLSFSLPTEITAPTAPSFTWTDAVAGTYTATSLPDAAVAPTYTKPTGTFDISQFETFLETNTDAELAQIQLGRLNHEVQKYQLDIQNELNEYNKELATYQAVMQQEIDQARLTQEQVLREASDTTELNKFNELQTLAEQVQEYQAVLGKHQSDVSNYAAQVSKEVQRIQTLIQQYSSMSQSHFLLLKDLKEEYNRSMETL